MARKIILDLDPGLGDAMAAVLALLDPDLDVLAMTATPGLLSPQQTTRNLQAVVEAVDPPKWPRIGAAAADLTGVSLSDIPPFLTRLNGSTGLGDRQVPVAEPHHRRDSAKVLVDLVRDQPHSITLVTLGPLTNLAFACDLCPDFFTLVEGVVMLGGAVACGGDVTAAAEFNIYRDPIAARRVLTGPEIKTLLPLDVAHETVLTLEEFSHFCRVDRPAIQFLQGLLNYSFRAHHECLGIEGIRIGEIAALAAVTRPRLFHTKRLSVGVELNGDLTRGMTVFDRRRMSAGSGTVNVVTEIDWPGVLAYIEKVLTSV